MNENRGKLENGKMGKWEMGKWENGYFMDTSKERMTHNSSIRFDEVLTLKTSTSETFDGGQGASLSTEN